MSFERFLTIVRQHFGYGCNWRFWKGQYNMLTDKSEEGVTKELPFLAVRAEAQRAGDSLHYTDKRKK